MNFTQTDHDLNVTFQGSTQPELFSNITTQVTDNMTVINDIGINSSMFEKVTSMSYFTSDLTTLTSITNMTTSEPVNAYAYLMDISENVKKVCNPILFLVGTVGNLLTILVLSQKKNRHTSTAMFLLILAISDIMILFTSYVSEWTFSVWRFDFREVNGALCKSHVFLTYYSLQFSSWTLVIVTCERAISVINPTKVRLICSRRRGMTILAIMAVFLAALNCHWLVGMVHNYNPYTQRYCAGSTQAYIDFLNDVWPIIDFCITFAFPFLFIVVGNIIILTKISRARNRRSHMVASDQKKNQSGLTITLIIVNVVFIVSMAPASIFLILYALAIETQDVEKITLAFFTFDMVNLLAGLNATLNFILYFLSGSKFRADVRELFSCKGSSKTGKAQSTMSSPQIARKA